MPEQPPESSLVKTVVGGPQRHGNPYRVRGLQLFQDDPGKGARVVDRRAVNARSVFSFFPPPPVGQTPGSAQRTPGSRACPATHIATPPSHLAVWPRCASTARGRSRSRLPELITTTSIHRHTGSGPGSGAGQCVTLSKTSLRRLPPLPWSS